MHAEAYEFVGQYGTDEQVTVLDVGGRNINGTARDHFPNANYTVLDILDGPGVDVVADAATWSPPHKYDVVVCCETFEHTPVWRDICRTLAEAVKVKGAVILTMAGPGRPPHSGFDGGPVHDGEHYENIDPDDLRDALAAAGFETVEIDVNEQSHDVRAWASKK